MKYNTLPVVFAGAALLASFTLAGCDDAKQAETPPSPAASADNKMGPVAPPADTASGPPTPFKGDGKIVKTASGLQYEEMTVGTGAAPKTGDTVAVNYVGTGESGEVFDSSYKHGQPIEFPLGTGGVIKGWDEGIATMKVGGRRKLIIPGNLAYGPNPSPGMPFKPNETLTFDVTLVGIK